MRAGLYGILFSFERWDSNSHCRTFEHFLQHTTGFVMYEKYRTRVPLPLAVSHRAHHVSFADVDIHSHRRCGRVAAFCFYRS